MRFIGVMVGVCVAAGCGDPPWTFPPDAGEEVADAGVDATEPVPDAAPPDAAVPVIDAVATVEGFHQVRQGDAAVVVITGRLLAGATAVTFGPLTATDVSPTDDGLRATLAIPHGHPPGALTLTVVTPAGSPTFPAAITATPVVVAVAGSATGRGTYESPWNLCDSPLATALRDDTIELSPGEHVCNRRIDLTPGVRVVGAGVDATVIVGGFGGFLVTGWGDDVGTTTLANFTVRDAAGDVLRLEEYAVDAVIDNLAVDGGAGSAVYYGWRDSGIGTLRVDRLRYRGTRAALSMLGMSSATIRDSDLRSTTPSACIGIDGGTVEISDTTIVGCGVGIHVRPWTRGNPWHYESELTVSDSVLRDTGIGIHLRSGRGHVRHVEIVDDPATAAVVQTAIELGAADLGLEDSRLEASAVGIHAFPIEPREGEDPAYNIRIEDSRVSGGRIGVDLRSTNDDAFATLSNAIIEGGEIGLRIWGWDILLSAGNCQFVSPGFAYVDERFDTPWGDPQRMGGGNLFNGNSYAGQRVEGPAERAPDYRIAHAIVYDF